MEEIVQADLINKENIIIYKGEKLRLIEECRKATMVDDDYVGDQINVVDDSKVFIMARWLVEVLPQSNFDPKPFKTHRNLKYYYKRFNEYYQDHLGEKDYANIERMKQFSISDIENFNKIDDFGGLF